MNEKERQIFYDILRRLKSRDTMGLNIIKLKGHKDTFRVRKRELRIIFQYDNDSGIVLLDLDRRSEDTYRRY